MTFEAKLPYKRLFQIIRTILANRLSKEVNLQKHILFANAEENGNGAWLLYQGIKNILRCDEAEVVSGIANYVMSQHRVLGKGAALMERKRNTRLPATAAF